MTVAAYVVSAILFVPTLIKLGVLPLAAHMFVFYFGIIAQITPPVCLASFTAAGIAGADSWKTGWTAFLYATVAFLVPFVLVYKPGLLLVGSLPALLEVL
ncbi:MAG: TRAP transporter large permease subunit, partial [Spirochaetales bacterium]